MPEHSPTTTVTDPLTQLSAFPGDWVVHSTRWRSGGVLELSLGPNDRATARISVAPSENDSFKAYKRGPVLSAAYEHVVGAGDAADEALQVAMRICEELALITVPLDLQGPRVAQETAGPPPPSRDAILEELRGRLPVGAELVDGWRLRHMAPVEDQEVHCIFEHSIVPIFPKLVLLQGSGDSREGYVGFGWRVTYCTRFGLTAPARMAAYHEILAEALADVLGAQT